MNSLIDIKQKFHNLNSGRRQLKRQRGCFDLPVMFDCTAVTALSRSAAEVPMICGGYPAYVFKAHLPGDVLHLNQVFHPRHSPGAMLSSAELDRFGSLALCHKASSAAWIQFSWACLPRLPAS